MSGSHIFRNLVIVDDKVFGYIINSNFILVLVVKLTWAPIRKELIPTRTPFLFLSIIVVIKGNYQWSPPLSKKEWNFHYLRTLDACSKLCLKRCKLRFMFISQTSKFLHCKWWTYLVYSVISHLAQLKKWFKGL